MKTNLFIDTNVWLSFFHCSSNDIKSYSTLVNWIKKNEIILYLPQQVIYEFHRNRESKFNDSYKNFKYDKISIPVFCQAYEEEYYNIQELSAKLTDAVNTLRGKVFKAFKNNSLKADELFKIVSEHAIIIDSDKYFDKAQQRYIIGNPPGKDNKYGDAINWEALLDIVPNGEDLVFISDDKDYKSVIDKNEFSPFLVQEWEDKKGSKIIFYTTIKSFVDEKTDDINNERKQNFDKLFKSGTFAKTHSIIEKLNSYDDFNHNEIELACIAFLLNDQIHWIYMDSDISDFYKKLLKDIDLEKEKNAFILQVYNKYF